MSEKSGKFTKALAQYSALIAILPASALGGYALGALLDELWGSDPWLTVICLLVGAGFGFYQMYLIIAKTS